MIAKALGRLLFRSSVKTNIPLSSNSDELCEILGAERSSTGEKIGREKALTYSPLWRACNLLSRSVAKPPLYVYKLTSRGKIVDKQHPAYRLLRWNPCPEMTSFVFRQTMQFHAMFYGNAFAYIKRTADGTPLEMFPLSPNATFPARVGGVLKYHTVINGEPYTLDPSNVIHVKALSFNGIEGIGILVKGRESIGIGLAMRKYGALFFKNNAQPSGNLEHPNTLSDSAYQRLKDSYSEEHGGLENAHRPKILEEGMKWVQVGINAKDAQLLEGRQFEVREVANWFNLPPHKLGDNSRLAYNSLEQENGSYLDDSLDPWLVNWEEELESKLLTEDQKANESHCVEFHRKALIRANVTDRASYFSKALGGHPWQTINEVREEEGLNPLDDPAADELPKPLNMSTGQKAGTDDEETPAKGKDKKKKEDEKPEEQDDEARDVAKPIRNLLLTVTQRMIHRLCVQAVKASKTPSQFNNWLEQVRTEHSGVVREAYAPVMDLLQAIGVESKDPTDTLFERVAFFLDDASGRLKRAEFETGIQAVCDELESKIPASIADSVIREEKTYKIVRR